MNTDQPWLTIWTRPRQTISRITAETPTRMVLPLAALAGIADALAQNRNNGGDLTSALSGIEIMMGALVAGPIFGIIVLYGFAALTWLTGRWIGGEGSPVTIRAAFAWASIPKITAMLVMLGPIVLYGPKILTRDIDLDDAGVQSWSDLVILGIFLVIIVALRIWSFVVYLHCLGQVQGFSAWKALGNSLLAVLVLVMPIALLSVILTAGS